MPKVYIVGRDMDIKTMFIRMGWDITDAITPEIDLIQFTGGEDVDPSYYGETKHAATRSNPNRDAKEMAIYNEWVGKLPMAGICRGAQFLNVANGGKMWQHVSGHAIQGTHEAFCNMSGQPLQVSSTHHQMMIPSPAGKVLMVANESSNRQTATKHEIGLNNSDVEVVLYPNTHCLCYQPHPEYVSINHDCQIKYFTYLDKFLL